MAQLVEQLIRNQQVVGSSPILSFLKPLILLASRLRDFVRVSIRVSDICSVSGAFYFAINSGISLNIADFFVSFFLFR